MVKNQLKKIRERHGLTQEELAAAIGVSRQTIIAIEKGNYVPSLLLAMRLARRLKIGVEELFSLQS